MTSENAVDAYEEYLNHIRDAERSLSQALDILYKPDGVRRGLGYKIRVMRAQNIAMTLFVREINDKEGGISGGAHEWEVVGNKWECIYCELRSTPKMIGKKPIFLPDVIRRVPFYGRRWRCKG